MINKLKKCLFHFLFNKEGRKLIKCYKFQSIINGDKLENNYV